MEAGIEPALPLNTHSKLYNVLVDLSDLCIKLCKISYYSDNYTEQKLTIHLLTTALSHSRSINLCHNLQNSIHRNGIDSTTNTFLNAGPTAGTSQTHQKYTQKYHHLIATWQRRQYKRLTLSGKHATTTFWLSNYQSNSAIIGEFTIF